MTSERNRVDYTNIRYAPVINCVVRSEDKILIVRRSDEVGFYPGYWNGISGFLDDDRDVKEKVKAELKEEIGLTEDHIKAITVGSIFHQEEPAYNKTWIVHPVLVDVDADEIELDWEAREHRWVSPAELDEYDLLPGFDRVVEIVLPE